MDNIPLGKRLKSERRRLGIIQDAAARIGGVSKSSLCVYEAGQRFPDARFLGRMAAAGFDINYIVTGKRSQDGFDPTGLSQEEVVLLNNYRSVSRDYQKHVSGVLSAIARV